MSRAEFSGKTVDSACQGLERAYQKLLRKEITDIVLGRWGMSIEEFRKQGLSNFGESDFSRMKELIDDFKLGIELLVCGFDERGHSHIVHVVDPGRAIIRDLSYAWAIGSGAWTALGALFRFHKIQLASLDELLYRACVAKFLSESARGVGKETDVFVFEPNYQLEIVDYTTMDTIRQSYDNTPPPPIPVNVQNQIGSFLQKRKPKNNTNQP